MDKWLQTWRPLFISSFLLDACDNPYCVKAPAPTRLTHKKHAENVLAAVHHSIIFYLVLQYNITEKNTWNLFAAISSYSKQNELRKSGFEFLVLLVFFSDNGGRPDDQTTLLLTRRPFLNESKKKYPKKTLSVLFFGQRFHRICNQIRGDSIRESNYLISGNIFFKITFSVIQTQKRNNISILSPNASDKAPFGRPLRLRNVYIERIHYEFERLRLDSKCKYFRRTFCIK